jgi:CheY-like chemotaxis protein
LVAEDNPVNRELAHYILDQLGAVSLMATNGLEALDVLARHSVDLVLMDCQMPELDGYQATERLREIESRDGRKRVPVIALTANALVGDRERCLAAGMDDYLPKPFTRNELFAVLRKWIDSDTLASGQRSDATKPAHVITPIISSRVGSPALILPVCVALSPSSDGGETLVGKLAQIFRDDAQLRRDQLGALMTSPTRSSCAARRTPSSRAAPTWAHARSPNSAGRSRRRRWAATFPMHAPDFSWNWSTSMRASITA